MQEGLVAGAERLHQRYAAAGPGRRVQLLVRLQEPLVVDQVGVVPVVEGVGRGEVEVVERAAGGGAGALQPCQVCRVQRGVGAAAAAEVVEPGAKRRAPSPADRVPAYIAVEHICNRLGAVLPAIVISLNIPHN